MGKKTKVTLNRYGIRDLLRSQEMKAVCEEHATAIRMRCGDGYKADSFIGKNRVNAMVWAESIKAKRENTKNNTIIKAMK